MIAEEQKEQSSEMLNKGIVLGHQVARRHPKMKPFISGIKAGFDVIDEEKTNSSLLAAKNAIRELILAGKIILVVGTKVQAKDMVKDFAVACNLPYVNLRWLGGTISNFEVLKKRVSHMKSIEMLKATGEISKYTKKEQGKMQKELEKLLAKYDGIRAMDKLPDAILVMDMKKDHFAIKEAKDRKITVIAVADTNVDPTPANYPIYASDDTTNSIKFVLDSIKESILSVRGPQAK